MIWNLTRIGSCLGGKNISRVLSWGLGSSLFEVKEKVKEVIVSAISSLGGGGKRTYLFVPRIIKFNVTFYGNTFESHFEIKEVRAKVTSKGREPLLIKAKRER